MKFIGTVRTVLLLFALFLVATAVAVATEYPSRPVKIIVPFAVGRTGDIVARTIALTMGKNTGAAFVVENRTGAGGRIGYEAGAKSRGDGYTFVATDATYTMLPG
ncbi:MAG: tripartite tricarboxylate transporter substrate binding protein, partial [Betaproteobacteria bacterium]